MKTSIYKFILLIGSFLSISYKGMSQDTLLKDAARDIISEATICTLITVDNDGRPRARVMETLPLGNDFSIWMGTNPQSRKVGQIKNNPNVSVYYLENDGEGYVTIYGKAEIVTESKAKETHWKEEWAAFYPNKKKDFVLIKVTPEWMEIISNTKNVTGDSLTWKAPIIKFNP